jgi:hypothetical protein
LLVLTFEQPIHYQDFTVTVLNHAPSTHLFLLFSVSVEIYYKLNQGCTRIFHLGGGSHPEAMCNLCVILKTLL